MKVFVGTMESGEADFAECARAIREQTHPHVQHQVISGLSEPEAHKRLYEAWEGATTEFDLFLKVDADTVLAHPHVITNIVALFESNPRLTGIQAWLFDHMTADKIFGLGCMRNTVKLTPVANPLYPDRVDQVHDLVLRGDNLPASLNPAGDHCRYASDEQAFRYGVHRALKGQASTIQKVAVAWRRLGGRSRAFALLGANQAAGFRQNLKINYVDEEFKEVFFRTREKYDELVKGLT